jgi:hypothetical protein
MCYIVRTRSIPEIQDGPKTGSAYSSPQNGRNGMNSVSIFMVPKVSEVDITVDNIVRHLIFPETQDVGR